MFEKTYTNEDIVVGFRYRDKNGEDFCIDTICNEVPYYVAYANVNKDLVICEPIEDLVIHLNNDRYKEI